MIIKTEVLIGILFKFLAVYLFHLHLCRGKGSPPKPAELETSGKHSFTLLKTFPKGEVLGRMLKTTEAFIAKLMNGNVLEAGEEVVMSQFLWWQRFQEY